MKDSRVYFDSNVVIYSIVKGDSRAETASQLLARGGVIGVQTLNEFVSVAAKKLSMAWPEVQDAVESLLVLCPFPVTLTLAIHRAGVALSRRYRFPFYDALVVAAALEARCHTLYSEDLRHDQKIAGLTIRNPFR
jgi:predicted nucleic acid-binding protein